MGMLRGTPLSIVLVLCAALLTSCMATYEPLEKPWTQETIAAHDYMVVWQSDGTHTGILNPRLEGIALNERLHGSVLSGPNRTAVDWEIPLEQVTDIEVQPPDPPGTVLLYVFVGVVVVAVDVAVILFLFA